MGGLEPHVEGFNTDDGAVSGRGFSTGGGVGGQKDGLPWSPLRPWQKFYRWNIPERILWSLRDP